jgi:hypothetical protein
MPSMEVSADVRVKRALDWWPWVRSFTHSPDAVIHSPAEMVAPWPMTVTRLRCPRAFCQENAETVLVIVKGGRALRALQGPQALPGSMVPAAVSSVLSLWRQSPASRTSPSVSFSHPDFTAQNCSCRTRRSERRGCPHLGRSFAAVDKCEFQARGWLHCNCDG